MFNTEKVSQTGIIGPMSDLRQKQNVSLKDLRDQIDSIDDQIHDLLMARTEIVKQVRQVKEGDKVKIRPAREAEIIYRLFARHKSELGKRELFRMWRELIVATLSFEGPFSIAVYQPVDDQHGFWDLARDQYGSFSPMTPFPSVRRVIDAVTTQEATVGIIPLPDPEDQEPWWPLLMNDQEMTPRVIARLPFCGPGNLLEKNAEALVIAPVDQEETGRDYSYIAIEAREDNTRDQVEKILAEVSIKPTYLGRWEPPNHDGVKLFLVETNEFIKPKDRRLGRIANGLGRPTPAIYQIGGYAEPISAKELGQPAKRAAKTPARKTAKTPAKAKGRK